MSLLEELKRIIEPITEEMGKELVEATLSSKGGRLTLYVAIDADGGISHQDCSLVSRRLSEELEKEDLIKKAYDLEVSSPGIERPLSKRAHFVRFIGSKIRLKTIEPIMGQRNFKGIIKKAGEKEIVIDLDDKTVKVDYQNISRANLKVDLKI